jgi:hypothetical protein
LLTAFVAVLLSQGIWWRGMLRYVDTHEVGWFGTPLYRLLPLRETLLQHDNVLLLENDARIDYSEQAAVWSVLLADVDCARALSTTDLLLLPSLPITIVAAPGSPNALVDIYGEEEPVQNEVPGGVYKLYQRNTVPMIEATNLSDWQARFRNGAALTGYRVTDDSLILRWTLLAASREDYHTFIHMLDVNGERIAQFDAPFLAGHYWCPGDSLVTNAALDVPEGAATLRVGMYVLRGGQFFNIDVLDSAGNPTASWVDIPLMGSETP